MQAEITIYTRVIAGYLEQAILATIKKLVRIEVLLNVNLNASSVYIKYRLSL